MTMGQTSSAEENHDTVESSSTMTTSTSTTTTTMDRLCENPRMSCHKMFEFLQTHCCLCIVCPPESADRFEL